MDREWVISSFPFFSRISFLRFYYDFLISDKQLTVGDLKAIKKEMDKIIKANLPIVKEDVQREDIKYVS